MIEILKNIWLVTKTLLWPIFEKLFMADYINTWVVYGILLLLVCGGLIGVSKSQRHKLWGLASSIIGILGTIFMLSSAN